MWPNPPYIFFIWQVGVYTPNVKNISPQLNPLLLESIHREQRWGKNTEQKTCLLKKVAVTLVDAFSHIKKNKAPTQRYGGKNKPPNVFI
jgi:hypothetical protein